MEKWASLLRNPSPTRPSLVPLRPRKHATSTEMMSSSSRYVANYELLEPRRFATLAEKISSFSRYVADHEVLEPRKSATLKDLKTLNFEVCC